MLFAYRAAVHRSTGFSPFFLLYNREPTLPLDVEYGILKLPETSEFDEDYVTTVAKDMQDIHECCNAKASANIEKTQAKQ